MAWVVALIVLVVLWVLFRSPEQPPAPKKVRLITCADCGCMYDTGEMQATPGVEGMRCPDCWGDLQSYIPRG